MAKPSVVKAPERNLVKTNVLAIHHGNITAKDARLFAQVVRTASRYGSALSTDGLVSLLEWMSTDELPEGWQGI